MENPADHILQAYALYKIVSKAFCGIPVYVTCIAVDLVVSCCFCLVNCREIGSKCK